VYTDGSGRTSKQGPQGSWGMLVENDKYYSLLGGYLEGVDSEEAELYAVFQALRYLDDISYPRNQVVVIYLDNLKVAQGAAGLMYRWRENGWRKSISCRPKGKKRSGQMIDVTYWWLWEDVCKRAPKSKSFLQMDKTFSYGR
jgi:ribonuclease HI